MQFPEWELAYWECFFAIDIAGDKPIVKRKEVTVEESIEAFKKVLT